VGVFDLLSIMSTEADARASNWRPLDPPSLDGITEIELDCESNGLRWWDGDRPCGFALGLPDGSTQYVPWGHRGGGNLDENVVRRWAQRELRGKRITNLNTKIDIHLLREWGVDLAAQGNTFADVGHYAALLDDHRGSVGSDGRYHGFSLASIVEDYLPDERKVTHVDGRELDASRMSEYPAHVVAVRAEADVRQVRKLRDIMRPLMTAQDLDRVRDLEERVIPVVCEMEKNGTRIDVERLHVWIKRIRLEIQALYMGVAREVGFQVNPRSPKDMTRLFEKLQLRISTTKAGKASFTADILKAIDHPIIAVMLRAKRLENIEAKLHKYRDSIGNSADGILRYALHQLKAKKDDWDEGDSGTVSGRFSSTQIYEAKNAGEEDEGINIQNVMKATSQRVKMGYDEDDSSHDDEIYIMRQLHVADPGMLFFSSDAMQIEYRMFADYTRSRRLLEIYEQDPLASFHKKMHAIFRVFKEDLTYRRQKDVNFAKVYTAGIRKMGWMLGYITKAEFDEISQKKHDRNWRTHPTIGPKLANVVEINAIYDREIPEARELSDKAMHLAKPACDDRCVNVSGEYRNATQRRLHAKYQHQGYVRTLEGRRGRFPEGKRLHKALNMVIQGGAADINKRKLVECYERRHEFGFKMRFTVHDELNGDVPDIEQARRIAAQLNYQSYPQLKVPILWDTGVGPNWKDTVAV
jgi:DNA polymerase-1